MKNHAWRRPTSIFFRRSCTDRYTTFFKQSL